MSESNRIRVVIADDQELVRAGFAMVIGSQPDMDVVGQAGDGGHAVELAERLHPDVVLMDVRMPGMDGIEATRRIVDIDAHGPRVIILTTFDLDEYVMAAIDAGASGFLLKDTEPETLLASIRTVFQGNAIIAPLRHETAHREDDAGRLRAERDAPPRRPHGGVGERGASDGGVGVGPFRFLRGFAGSGERSACRRSYGRPV